jgi:hypothetical protein
MPDRRLDPTVAMTAFDRVQLKENDGTVQSLTPEEFRRLSVRDRVRYLLAGKAEFFLRGDAVPPQRRDQEPVSTPLTLVPLGIVGSSPPRDALGQLELARD